VGVCVWVCVCGVCVCMYMAVCMYVFMRVYMCMYVCTYVQNPITSTSHVGDGRDSLQETSHISVKCQW